MREDVFILEKKFPPGRQKGIQFVSDWFNSQTCLSNTSRQRSSSSNQKWVGRQHENPPIIRSIILSD